VNAQIAMTASIQPADLGFFSTLASATSLSAAAREMGVTTPAVSKHLALMEARVGVLLVNRSMRKHPEVEVQLQLSVSPPAVTEDLFDVCIRFGAPPDSRVIARNIGANRRLLCAAPAYLAKHGLPKVPNDLAKHNCIGIRQGEEAYGVWRLTSGKGRNAKSEAVKTRGNLTTNDGGIAVNWALDGHGIVMRAEWDVARHLATGRLVQVLPQYFTPEADIYAVYPQRLQLAARVRAFVDFLAAAFAEQAAEKQ
jgi:LysR family transcriptional activator of dmlA